MKGIGNNKKKPPKKQRDRLLNILENNLKINEELIKRIEYLETKCNVLESSINDVRCDLIK